MNVGTAITRYVELANPAYEGSHKRVSKLVYLMYMVISWS